MRAMVKMVLGADRWLVLLAKNEDPLDAYVLTPAQPKKLYRFEADENAVWMDFAEGGRQKMEYYRGSGYLSQQSRYFEVPPGAISVEWRNAAGKLTRKLNLSDDDPNQ